MAKEETVLGMVGEYLRELSVLVLVFFPLELSKGGDLGALPKATMVRVAEFSFGMFGVGVIFSKWSSLSTFFRRVVSALKKEFGGET